jgi:NAD(P)H-dependent FMN reductase
MCVQVKDMLQKLPGSTAATWSDTIDWADALILLTPGEGWCC